MTPGSLAGSWLLLQERVSGAVCLVVGAGPVGLRKTAVLQNAGARVRLVDPGPEEGPPGAQRIRRAFRPDDLEGVRLAVAAAADREVNRAVAAEARRRGIPVNVADAPEEGDLAFPALLQRGELTLGVATAGGSPALAALLRDRLAAEIGPEWALILEIAAALRRKALTPECKNKYNQEVLRGLLEDGLPVLAAAGDAAGIDRLLALHLGRGVSLQSLGVRPPEGMP